MVQRAGKQQKNTRYGEYEEEKIISFPKALVAFVVMMVLVQIPQKAMHNVLMGKPRNTFHANKGASYY